MSPSDACCRALSIQCRTRISIDFLRKISIMNLYIYTVIFAIWEARRKAKNDYKSQNIIMISCQEILDDQFFCCVKKKRKMNYGHCLKMENLQQLALLLVHQRVTIKNYSTVCELVFR